MAEKAKHRATVLENRELTEGIFSLQLQVEAPDFLPQPGQFVGLYPHDKTHLLPRPISVCDYDAAAGALRLVYRRAGKGTAEIAGWQKGDAASFLGPLGHGYPLEKLRGKRVALLGGGIGIPPLLYLAMSLLGEAEVTAVLGYRNADLFLREEFAPFANLRIATEDGSVGVKGTVLDALAAEGTFDVLCACGPTPMLRAVKHYAVEHGQACYLSLEEHMACGVGVCLGCVCKTTGVDAHSHVHNARVCTEGPVFAAEEVDL